MKIEKKFLQLCYTISNDSGNKYEYWRELLENFSDDADYEVLKTKMNNFVKLLNEDDKIWFDKDVELEIFQMV
jgi:hypothetical protein